jgi:carboxypeptidase Taq
MPSKLDQLKSILGEVEDLKATTSVLQWDLEVNMPPGGLERRSHQIALLDRMSHEKFTSDQVGNLLTELEDRVADLDPDSDEVRLIQVTSREYSRATRVPPEHVSEFRQATTRGFKAWQEAREQSDYSIFKPHLEKLVSLQRRYANYFQPYDHIYDPLLDQYEPGMKTKDVQLIFADLRPKQVDLVQALGNSGQVDDSFLKQAFDEQIQWEFGEEVISNLGYDWDHGRQDRSPHPFTIDFGREDVRITTRIDPFFFNPGFFSTLHECGHALYNQGVDSSLARTPLEGGASLGIHESQSRLWENLIGRSLPFWEGHYPRLQELFPTQLGSVDLQTFYRGINRVEPTLIRVDADEATYNLHIMLRLELEIALIEGTLEVDGLPAAWNDGMQSYLGITPPDDAHGVLQDVHWASGLMGYFPTYSLGNLISLQLWERIKQDLPNLDDDIRQGEFSNLLGWLRENVHRHGAKFEPQEMVERITGSKIDAQPYLRYLDTKFSKIYGL